MVKAFFAYDVSVLAPVVDLFTIKPDDPTLRTMLPSEIRSSLKELSLTEEKRKLVRRALQGVTGVVAFLDGDRRLWVASLGDAKACELIKSSSYELSILTY